jgi:hypothetical protein
VYEWIASISCHDNPTLVSLVCSLLGGFVRRRQIYVAVVGFMKCRCTQ